MSLLPVWAWDGQSQRVEDIKATALRYPSQSQYIKADVAHPDRLVQVELDDGYLLYRALVAQQAPTVAARVHSYEKTPDYTHSLTKK